jgi:hypothetical protein
MMLNSFIIHQFIKYLKTQANGQQTVTPGELSISNMWQLEALYRLCCIKVYNRKRYLDEFKA